MRRYLSSTGKILPGKDFGDAAGDGRTDRDQDMFGHGTAMASIMVARPTLLDITGLAPDARVLPIAVPIQGTSDASVSDHVPDAIRWAVRSARQGHQHVVGRPSGPGPGHRPVSVR